MAALSDFKDVPALKYMYVKDAKRGNEAFFDFDGAIHRIQGIEYDLTRIKNDILKLKDKFKELDAALEAVEQALDEVKQVKQELLQAMEQLENKVDGQIASLQVELGKLEARVTALENRCTGLEAGLADTNKKLADAQKNITALQGEVTKIKADIAALQGEIAKLKNEIKRLDGELALVKQDLLDNYAKLKKANVFTAANTFNDLVTVSLAPRDKLHAANKKYVDEQIEKFKVPSGTIVAFAGQIVPDGYLLCDGSNILKVDYPDLYKVLGGFYGETDTTFRLPDLRDRFIQGGSMPSPQSQEPALPNIMGTFTGFGDPIYTDGAFRAEIAPDARGKVAIGAQDGMLYVDFDASRYSSYYKNGVAKVTPPCYIMMFLIKA